MKAYCWYFNVCVDGSNEWPKGLLVTPSVSAIPAGQIRIKMPVEVVNHFSHPVTVPKKARICYLYNTEDVTSLNTTNPHQLSKEVSEPAKGSFMDHFKYLEKIIRLTQRQKVDKLLGCGSSSGPWGDRQR